MIRLSQLNEASEIEFKDLQPTQQKQVQAFEKLIGGKIDSIFDGIHGFIVDIKVSGGHGNYRFEADDLKKLLSLKVRWIEACLLYTSPSPRDRQKSRMPSSA